MNAARGGRGDWTDDVVLVVAGGAAERQCLLRRASVGAAHSGRFVGFPSVPDWKLVVVQLDADSARMPRATSTRSSQPKTRAWSSSSGRRHPCAILGYGRRHHRGASAPAGHSGPSGSARPRSVTQNAPHPLVHQMRSRIAQPAAGTAAACSKRTWARSSPGTQDRRGTARHELRVGRVVGGPVARETGGWDFLLSEYSYARPSRDRGSTASVPRGPSPPPTSRSTCWRTTSAEVVDLDARSTSRSRRESSSTRPWIFPSSPPRCRFNRCSGRGSTARKRSAHETPATTAAQPKDAIPLETFNALVSALGPPERAVLPPDLHLWSRSRAREADVHAAVGRGRGAGTEAYGFTSVGDTDLGRDGIDAYKQWLRTNVPRDCGKARHQCRLNELRYKPTTILPTELKVRHRHVPHGCANPAYHLGRACGFPGSSSARGA